MPDPADQSRATNARTTHQPPVLRPGRRSSVSRGAAGRRHQLYPIGLTPPLGLGDGVELKQRAALKSQQVA
jgi:hypothetical protein